VLKATINWPSSILDWDMGYINYITSILLIGRLKGKHRWNYIITKKVTKSHDEGIWESLLSYQI